MLRFLRISILAALVLSFFGNPVEAKEIGQVEVSGRINPGDVRIFLKDSTYFINHEYVVGGALIIEPGTKVFFRPNSRIVDSIGGRIIADGYADATYAARPNGWNPEDDPGVTNPEGWTGYADLNYFSYNGSGVTPDNTVSVDTDREPTVHADKENYIYNVVLNTATRQISDLVDPATFVPGPNEVIINHEQAIMYVAARLNNDPNVDPNLNANPWQRVGGASASVAQAPIEFLGQPANSLSREWGHIIVLPGARGAFFRNVKFEHFKNDTTVDQAQFFSEGTPGPTDWKLMNNKMKRLVAGSGGALTSFSSRTWLIDASFSDNEAKYRGGALQLLQSPMGFATSYNTSASLIGAVGTYAANKNPNVSNRDNSPSDINTTKPVPAIDMIDEPGAVEPLADDERLAHDDGRLALFLARVRNLTFDNNSVDLVNYGILLVGNPPRALFTKLVNEPADYPQNYGNEAFGGAVYMAGAEGQENRRLEVGFGINHSIMIDGALVTFDKEDTFSATGNSANNYQNSGSSMGARGGAIYVGKYTSLILAGNYSSNETYTKFLQDKVNGLDPGLFSMGGAVFAENTLGRLQVVGGVERDNYSNVTRFSNNKAGAGGAIYVDGNTDTQMSPVIGGVDNTLETRNKGFDILFENNEALSYGGAVFTKRNAVITGGGGVHSNEIVGYGGKYPVRFMNNTAGYDGGAVSFHIPNGIPLPAEQRAVELTRVEFEGNTVGQNITSENFANIRGGGAVYAMNADLNVVKGSLFMDNTVYNGNGGAIALVHPQTSSRRYFLTDLDMLTYAPNGVADGYNSVDGPFIYEDGFNYPSDARMLTRFINNKIVADQEALDDYSGSGTTQQEAGTFRTRVELMSTHWTSASTGVSVGVDGTIVRFTDGGEQWAYPASGTNYRLNAVTFPNPNTGYAVGTQGEFLRSNDKGVTWNRINLGTLNRVNDVFFVGTNNGFAVADNGMIFRTTDGGDNWTSSTPEPVDLHGVHFTSSNHGYAVGDDKVILRTTDGGDNWEVQVPSIPAYNLKSVSFLNKNNGYITGNGGTLLRTTDGGDNWELVNTTVSTDINDAHFISQDIGFLVTRFGDIISTNDGGQTWTIDNTTTNYGLNSVHFPTSSTGFIAGEFGLVLKTEDGGQTWNSIDPKNNGVLDVVRVHPEALLPENGIGLGGAIYVLDKVIDDRVGREDTVSFNRVRIQNNEAYTGAAIYSDNYDLKLLFSRSLITGNVATSSEGASQNAIAGPVLRDANGDVEFNKASTDLAGAVIYGEVQGPLPSYTFSEAANSFFDNSARFLIRLPDAPNTKGILIGTTGIGIGGTDTLRGNYWGQTEANVNVAVSNGFGLPSAEQETFFVAGDGNTHLRFTSLATSDPRNQGPFESVHRFDYDAIPLENDGADEDTPSALSIPENLLMSGQVYDLFDKGTDIKTADYSKRRMSPIEDFAVGIPATLRRFDDDTKPSNTKYVRRMVRDPFCVTALDQDGNVRYPFIGDLQYEFTQDFDGNYYHPIGHPIYLETMVDYDGIAERSNHDPLTQNESVFFVINESTGDFIRVNLKQVSEDAPFREMFRATVELVPDSTNRNANSLFRRTTEGLFNFGTGNPLLEKLEDNPSNEDMATLQGRRYSADDDALGNSNNLFNNRPDFDDASSTIDTPMITYFAGERYRSLPVNVGDKVRIISRTVLWKEGVVPAYDDGIEFVVSESTTAPRFTGNVMTTDTTLITKILPSEDPVKNAAGIPDTVSYYELQDKIWVTEDRNYPAEFAGQYSGLDILEGKGTDSIMVVTAVDDNQLYDPRSYTDDNAYARLDYKWYVNGNSAAKRWLQVDTVYVNDNEYGTDAYYGAKGYLAFRGSPTNPYVVPGGEKIKVVAENYPPHWRTLDSLKAAGWEGLDTLAKMIETYPTYFHAESYDMNNTRFLQQDTINVGSTYSIEYEYNIFVVDSTPVYLDETAADEELYRYNKYGEIIDTIVRYAPSVFTCERTEDGKLLANVTDMLRFQGDINTDDELEDLRAEEIGWDFTYGRTAYGYMNYAHSAGDTVILDDVNVTNDTGDNIVIIDQVRPRWMGDDYHFRFGTAIQGTNDFTNKGQYDIKMDRATAIDLMTPNPQYAGALNTDSVFSVVVNDGHGGKTVINELVHVNFSPVITTETLPDATEDYDYNYDTTAYNDGDPNHLLDSNKRILVADVNFNEDHTYRLIYFDEDDITIDPCFDEAGVWTSDFYGSGNDEYTPEWLKINEESGMLYGTPTITDAPKTVKVVVLVTDKNGLADLKILDLKVNPTNHNPDITAIPPTICFDVEEGFSQDITIADLDFLREGGLGSDETVTVTLVGENAGSFEVNPSVITGPTSRENTVVLSLTGTPVVGSDNKVSITIVATDAKGAESTREYKLKLSEETDFVSTITVKNSLGATQELVFGVSNGVEVSTGDGNDDTGIPGKIDPNYCEFELPPFPQLDVFDARWQIPTINGIARSIFPRDASGNQVWVAKIQPGGELSDQSVNYPLTISWDMTTVPAVDDAEKNPTGSVYYLRDNLTNDGDFFSVRMDNGEGRVGNATYVINILDDIVTVTINNPPVGGFFILRDVNNSTKEDASFVSDIKTITPNPVKDMTTIDYEVNTSSAVTIDIVDNAGNVLVTLVNEDLLPGSYSVNWNASTATGMPVASGTYNVRFKSNNNTSVHKVVIVK